MCIGPTRRQRARSTAVPRRADCSSITSQWLPSALNPSTVVALTDNNEQPYLDASRGPDGDTIAATAISNVGCVYGRSCKRASWSVNHDVLRVTGSGDVSNAMIASSASSIMSRCCAGSIPSMYASDASAPGPTPSIVRPCVRWSSKTMRSASKSGW